MIHIAPSYRAFMGGMVAGLIGVAVLRAPRLRPIPCLRHHNPPRCPPPKARPRKPAPEPADSSPPRRRQTRLCRHPPPPSPRSQHPRPRRPRLTPAVTGTLRDYLQAKGVKLEAQKPQGFKALDITLPVPGRWTQVPDPNVPDAFAVIADRLGNSLYTSNAQVVVYKLVGKFDPKEAITHGFVDSQQLPAWQTTNASQADFAGFPSSVIEGTYRQNDMTLNTSRRHVIATSGSDKYLVSLSVTTALSQAVADGPATDAIINGFRIAAPGADGARPPAQPRQVPHAARAPAQARSGPVQPDIAPAARAEPVDPGTRTAAAAELHSICGAQH